MSDPTLTHAESIAKQQAERDLHILNLRIDELQRAINKIEHEVTHKRGGPEKKQCISTTYIFRVIQAVKNGTPVRDVH